MKRITDFGGVRNSAVASQPCPSSHITADKRLRIVPPKFGKPNFICPQTVIGKINLLNLIAYNKGVNSEFATRPVARYFCKLFERVKSGYAKPVICLMKFVDLQREQK